MQVVSLDDTLHEMSKRFSMKINLNILSDTTVLFFFCLLCFFCEVMLNMQKKKAFIHIYFLFRLIKFKHVFALCFHRNTGRLCIRSF